MIAGERQGSAHALYLEVIAHGGGWEYKAAPYGSGYWLALVLPRDFDETAEEMLLERVRRHKPRLLGMMLVPDEDTAAVIREARR